ncbi:MAG: phosphohistidine phosphatase SixA [Bacteroidetes bacterium]|nr:phosphohistidine phosphatase SixA [Bacteroidota bacterium]
MLLYIIRHGIAEKPTGFLPDKDRSLTSEGTAIVSKLANALNSKGVKPDLIISSPYLRAKQTADLLANGLKYTNSIETDNRLMPNATMTFLQEILLENSDKSSLMIISHEPAVSEFSTTLCASNADRVYGFSPASICCVIVESIPTIRGSLYWFASAEEIIESV